VNSYVFPEGGGSSANGQFDLLGTGGQDDTGFSRGGTYTLDSGFWGAGTLMAITPAGTNTTVSLGIVTVTFANVSTAGTTYLTPIDPNSSGNTPSGYMIAGLAFDITTTAVYSGPISVCFSLPAITDPSLFSRVRVLHGENGTLVDRTTSQDFTTKTVCGTVDSLSPFAVAIVITPQAIKQSVLDHPWDN